jgi:dihydrofolate synthase / folylpolyglutamate synthase
VEIPIAIIIIMPRDWLEGLRARGMSLGLDLTYRALERLGNPQKASKAIHVAGSNGKGTTCAILSAALILSGQKVGTFTSPHVSRIEERIRINGVPVSSSVLDDALFQLMEIDEGMTFFEATWLAACIVFERMEVDIMVVEVGLGGRLDATRTCDAMSCLVTSISLEHREILGETIQEIALEKAAIASQSIPLVMKYDSLLVDEVEKYHQVQWVSVPNVDFTNEAAILAKAALLKCGFDEAASAVEESLKKLNWPGRMQNFFIDDIEFLLDAAHNPSGMIRFVEVLETLIQNKPWSLIFGSSPQHNLEEFIQPLVEIMAKYPPTDVVCTEPQGGRYPAIKASLIPFGRSIPSPRNALNQIKGNFIVSCGSLYLQGNLLKILGKDSDEDLSLL